MCLFHSRRKKVASLKHVSYHVIRLSSLVSAILGENTKFQVNGSRAEPLLFYFLSHHLIKTLDVRALEEDESEVRFTETNRCAIFDLFDHRLCLLFCVDKNSTACAEYQHGSTNKSIRSHLFHCLVPQFSVPRLLFLNIIKVTTTVNRMLRRCSN